MLHHLVCRAACVVVGLVSLGAAQAQDDQQGTLDKIRTTHTITLGVRELALPFAAFVDGVAQGYSVDICKSIVTGLEKSLKQKIDIKYMPVTAGNRIAALKAGTIDLECGSTTDTIAREKEVAFSFPIFITGTRMAVRKESTIMNYDDMPGARVVVVGGTSAELLLRPVLLTAESRGRAFTVSKVKNNTEGIRAVAGGAADAFITDDVLLAGAIASNQLLDKVQRVSKPLSIEPYAIMARKGDTEFLNAVDRVLAERLTSGEAAKLGVKWFDTPNLRYKFNHMTMAVFMYPNKSPAYPNL